MRQRHRATLTDWAWVEVMVMQAMVGCVTPELSMVVVTEEPEEWLVTFFFRSAISEDEQQDYVEIAGDAMGYLEQSPSEPVHTTAAILRPMRSVLKFETPPPLFNWISQENSRVLFCVSPSLIWPEAGHGGAV